MLVVKVPTGLQRLGFWGSPCLQKKKKSIKMLNQNVTTQIRNPHLIALEKKAEDLKGRVGVGETKNVVLETRLGRWLVTVMHLYGHPPGAAERRGVGPAREGRWPVGVAVSAVSARRGEAGAGGKGRMGVRGRAHVGQPNIKRVGGKTRSREVSYSKRRLKI